MITKMTTAARMIKPVVMVPPSSLLCRALSQARRT